jgi:hypothetical protein
MPRALLAQPAAGQKGFRTAPGLCGGQAAGTLDAVLALMGTVGWDLICARARQALEAVPGTAVLAGLSMGAGVIGSVSASRPTPKRTPAQDLSATT